MMLIQYIIVGVIICIAVAFVVVKAYRSVKQNIRCKDYKCAGCAFYDKCKKAQKR